MPNDHTRRCRFSTECTADSRQNGGYPQNPLRLEKLGDLGLFTDEESQIGDFITSFPTLSTGSLKAQINVYDVTVTGDFDGPFAIHFDLYNHVGAENHVKYKFAPFSHDADGTPGDGPDINEMPEPASATLLGMACLSLLGGRCLRRRQKSAAA